MTFLSVLTDSSAHLTHLFHVSSCLKIDIIRMRKYLVAVSISKVQFWSFEISDNILRNRNQYHILDRFFFFIWSIWVYN